MFQPAPAYRALCLLFACLPTCLAHAADGAREDLQAESAALNREFQQTIAPLLHAHCAACHASDSPEAELDLTEFQTLSQITAAYRQWETVLQRVAAGEMPPEGAEVPLSDRDRQSILNWLRSVRRNEALKSAGDPGPVLPRRLSNSEYDASIRDLTGVDIRPTRNFPVDPANEAGFDNSGESLSMSPALLNKYLEAAREVAEHLVLTPNGIRFAPHPVMTDTDRDKYCVKRIVEFYERQPTDLAAYFLAAWEWEQQAFAEKTTLNEIAERHAISPRYLSQVQAVLQEATDGWGPLAELRKQWQALPGLERPEDAQVVTAQAKLACASMRDFVLDVRPHLEPYFDNLSIEGVHKGSQSFVLWKNKQYAQQRRQADFSFLQEEDRSKLPSCLKPPATADELKRFKKDCRKFCAVFPDAFYVSERGRDYLDKPRDEQEKGRLLSAGFHSMMGYFRDDQPLVELVLDKNGKGELDALWQELDFITSAPQRQYQGFLWFERTDSRFMRDPEFDFARPEDHTALSSDSIQRLSEVYLTKATAAGGQGEALSAIKEYFKEIDQQIRWVEQARVAAEPHQWKALLEFAARAFRRPLEVREIEELREYYQWLRSDAELSHEEALQDVLVSLLMSPKFCYRLDLLSDSPDRQPLSDWDLASRLSYFLWSSVPDEELWATARRGVLRQPQVLQEQVRRMLRDDRARGLAVEFGTNWLDIRRFEEHNSVDRERFPSFNDELRAAMFEEPVQLLLDVMQNDRPLLELIETTRTYVNPPLARHYGMDSLVFTGSEWLPVADASAWGRGGLLPMAVFLTKNAPGLRTSPVKRGYWVVKRLLGEHIPAPPADVPDLPSDESQLGELTLRETLAQHRQHASCSGCHNRIDSFGLVFEGYGPVGERRQLDLAGRAIDDSAEFPEGTHGTGVEDLRDYISRQRADDFLDNFRRKLLSYALSRSLQLSDEPLLESMVHSANASSDAASRSAHSTFSDIVISIVTSPQFLHKRGS